MCYNINNPIDIRIAALHEQAKLDMLSVLRELSLLCLMYVLRQENLYEKIANRVTHARDGYIF